MCWKWLWSDKNDLLYRLHIICLTRIALEQFVQCQPHWNEPEESMSCNSELSISSCLHTELESPYAVMTVQLLRQTEIVAVQCIWDCLLASIQSMQFLRIGNNSDYQLLSFASAQHNRTSSVCGIHTLVLSFDCCCLLCSQARRIGETTWIERVTLKIMYHLNDLTFM